MFGIDPFNLFMFAIFCIFMAISVTFYLSTRRQGFAARIQSYYFPIEARNQSKR